MPYAQTIATYFKVLGPAGAAPEWQNVAVLKGLFVPDAAPYPNVGLTTGGPQFTGRGPIGVLFTHLFHCFPNVVLQPANGLQLTDGNSIAIEATLSTGNQQNKWAPGGNPSPPVSTVVPDGHHQSQNLPVCAVFTFDPNNSLIQNLALYFDRWKLAMDLWDHAHPNHIA